MANFNPKIIDKETLTLGDSAMSLTIIMFNQNVVKMLAVVMGREQIV